MKLLVTLQSISLENIHAECDIFTKTIKSMPKSNQQMNLACGGVYIHVQINVSMLYSRSGFFISFSLVAHTLWNTTFIGTGTRLDDEVLDRGEHSPQQIFGIRSSLVYRLGGTLLVAMSCSVME